jgi:hypothetical protein
MVKRSMWLGVHSEALKSVVPFKFAHAPHCSFKSPLICLKCAQEKLSTKKPIHGTIRLAYHHMIFIPLKMDICAREHFNSFVRFSDSIQVWSSQTPSRSNFHFVRFHMARAQYRSQTSVYSIQFSISFLLEFFAGSDPVRFPATLMQWDPDRWLFRSIV